MSAPRERFYFQRGSVGDGSSSTGQGVPGSADCVLSRLLPHIPDRSSWILGSDDCILGKEHERLLIKLISPHKLKIE